MTLAELGLHDFQQILRIGRDTNGLNQTEQLVNDSSSRGDNSSSSSTLLGIGKFLNEDNTGAPYADKIQKGQVQTRELLFLQS